MDPMDQTQLRHRQVDVEGLGIHVVEGGAADKPAVVFLHGWPQCWAAFERVMILLAPDARAVAIDLPGIGGSTTPPPANDKRTLAKYVRGAIRSLGLRDVTLVGHDAGGQIAYAYLQAYPDELGRAVLMNIVIPGVDPWSEVERNPHIWHFRFHAIPDLPEQLVAGREAAYFDYFFDTIAAKPGAVPAEARARYVEAYSRPDALRTGFEWYRAFAKDEKDNARRQLVSTPVLYLRGEKEQAGIDLARYVDGLREAGLQKVGGALIADSGHFAPDEQPQAVAALLRKFLGLPT
jgi:pimeloyl-ACP methyl ester carboxylesterase